MLSQRCSQNQSKHRRRLKTVHLGVGVMTPRRLSACTYVCLRFSFTETCPSETGGRFSRAGQDTAPRERDVLEQQATSKSARSGTRQACVLYTRIFTYTVLVDYFGMRILRFGVLIPRNYHGILPVRPISLCACSHPFSWQWNFSKKQSRTTHGCIYRFPGTGSSIVECCFALVMG